MKVQQILDIWTAGLGVVSLHVFQNVIPEEAYTREACMIDALGMAYLNPWIIQLWLTLISTILALDMAYFNP